MSVESAPDPQTQEARALRWSAGCALALAVLGTAMSWLSLRASALVLLGTFCYACVDALLVLLSGGGDTSLGSTFVYSLLTLVAVVVLRAVLARRSAGPVLVAALVVLPTPIRMLRTAFRELLEGVPDPEVTDPIREAIGDPRGEFGLPEPQCRIGKLGRKVNVELHTDPAWDY